LTRALILGATSLVGNNVLRAAIAAGWETVAFDRPERRRRRHPSLEALEFEIASGEESDPEALRQAMLNCDVVFHTDSYSPPNSLHAPRRRVEAREQIDHVLKALRGSSVGRFVYTSSVNTVGRSDSPTRLPDEWNPYRLGQVAHPHWDAKLIQEEAVLAFGRRGEIPVVITNVSEVVGPYDFSLIAAGQLLEMVRRGIRQYLPGRVSVADVRDVAQGHLAAAQLGRVGERYILAGHNISHQEKLAIMARACKRPPPEVPVDMESTVRGARFSERLSCFGRPNRPFPLSYQLESLRQCRWYDSGKAREELAYRNRPLINTYRATLAWLKEVGKLR
jgi:dihydroflavonol-4-reductase